MVVDAGDRRRHRPAARARPLPGLLRRGVRRLERRRAAARRLLRRQPVVALDLLHQPADRRCSRSVVIAAAFHARSGAGQATIDYLGAALLAGGLAAIVLYTSLGRHDLRLGLARDGRARRRSGSCCIVAFVLVERRAAEPILPLRLFREPRLQRRRARSASWSASRCSASITYLPLFLQIVRGDARPSPGLLHDADDGGRPDHVDRQRPADQPHRPLQALPDRRHAIVRSGCCLLCAARA